MRASRRFVVGGIAALPFAPGGVLAATRPRRVFVGTVTMSPADGLPPEFGRREGRSDGIYSFEFDPRDGRAGPPVLAAPAGNPQNLIPDAAHGRLYVCNGMNTRVGGQNGLSAYAIEGASLRLLNRVPSGGGGPTHGTVDRRGRYLLTTHFATSSIVCFRLGDDGRIGARTAFLGPAAPAELPPPRAPGAAPTTGGLGERTARQSTKPHIISLSRSERYAVVAEIDTNRCVVLRFDASSGALLPHAEVECSERTGPRHLAWHPSWRHFYTSDEHGATISVWRWHERSGRLEFLGSQPLVAAGESFRNHPADIAVHPGGRFVYVSNRGGPAISGFAISRDGAGLTRLTSLDVPDTHCWCLEFDPSGRWLLAAMQPADHVAIFAVDPASGALTPHGRVGPIVMPTCLAMI